MADPYDFDAPQYFDFVKEQEEEQQQHMQHMQAQQPTTMMKAAVTAAAASSTVPAGAPAQPTKSEDPWEFDAPTWSDLGASREFTATAAAVPSSSSSSSQPPPQQPAVPSSPVRAPAAAAAATGAATTPAAAARRPVSPLTSTSKIAAAGAAVRRSAPPSPAKAAAPTSNPSVAGITASLAAAAINSSGTGTPERRRAATPTAGAGSGSGVFRPASPSSRAPAAAAAKAPVVAAAAAAAGGGAVSAAAAQQKKAAQLAARTFVNRPRKEAATAPAAPVQHSYLSHTAATAKRRAAVDSMASFLRPTASSWSRNQKEGPNANPNLAAATSTTTAPRMTTSSSMRTATGPVRAAGPMGGGATRKVMTASGSSSSLSRGAVPRHHQQQAATAAGHGKIESTEERQLREAAEAQKRMKEQRKANDAACHRNRAVGSAAAAAPLRSTKALTIPQSPQLRLAARHGEKRTIAARSASAAEPTEVDHGVEFYYKPRPPSRTGHTSSGGSSSHNATTGPKPLTIPVGPALHTDTRASARRAASPQAAEAGSEAFGGMSVAAAVDPAKAMHLREYAPKPPSPRGLTIPQSPFLATKTRAAGRPVAGAAAGGGGVAGDKEERDLEECKHQFKARPLDRRVLEAAGGMVGVPKVNKSEVTQPKPFHFKTDARLRGTSSQAAHEEQQQHQHSHRQQQHHQQPARHGASKQHHHQELVVPKPFQLETEKRGQVHQMAFQAKLQQAAEAERAQHEVHAQPLPDFRRIQQHQQQHHAPPPRELTEPRPFHLESARRHDESQAQFQARVEQEREEARRQAEVRARPLPASTFQRSFELKPSDREPLIPMSTNLSTEARAEERKHFEAEQAARQAAQARAAAEAEARKRAAEEEELRRLRATPVEEGGMQFKARPVLHAHHHLHHQGAAAASAAPMAAAVSAKELTVPVSPQLQTAHRAHIRPQAHPHPHAHGEQQQHHHQHE